MNRDRVVLRSLLEDETIYGLGISFRNQYDFGIDDYFIKHPRVVLHVIAGIDIVDTIINNPIKKVLVLGYKTFGFGVEYYSDDVKNNIKQWYWWVKKLIDAKDVVSFDNLGLEQLNIKRFLTDDKWEEFNQGEHSFYINAVEKYFAPSSRNPNKTNWNNLLIQDYFKTLEDDKVR
jgi:hypothetical protein